MQKISAALTGSYAGSCCDIAITLIDPVASTRVEHRISKKTGTAGPLTQCSDLWRRSGRNWPSTFLLSESKVHREAENRAIKKKTKSVSAAITSPGFGRSVGM
jgi:hypothetical protein